VSSVPEADLGAANARTALAWQRTSLSLVAAAAVMARLTWGSLGGAALVPLVAALVLSLWVFAESGSRSTRDPGPGSRVRPRGGRAPLALALATALVAATELATLWRS
jgi:Domain of unknown function (DUF202)